MVNEANPNTPKSIRVWKWWQKFRGIQQKDEKWTEWDKEIYNRAFSVQNALVSKRVTPVEAVNW